jgi:hypothetical protein
MESLCLSWHFPANKPSGNSPQAPSYATDDGESGEQKAGAGQRCLSHWKHDPLIEQENNIEHCSGDREARGHPNGSPSDPKDERARKRKTCKLGVHLAEDKNRHPRENKDQRARISIHERHICPRP